MSNMNFDTSNKTLRSVLGNGLMYRVPKFQRDYTWTDEEWDDLWQDILEQYHSIVKEQHYMGYLVLQTNDNKTFDIIDGQQRLATISILILSALKHLQKLVDNNIDKENNESRLRLLRSTYIGYLDPVTLLNSPKLVLNRHNDYYYQYNLVILDNTSKIRLNHSEQLMRKAFQWHYEAIQKILSEDLDGRMIAELIDVIADKLFFTVITVSDELNAYKVFETLNARGVRLSTTDLLKNYLFSVISKLNNNDNEIDSLEMMWERIIGNLGSDNFPDYIRHYWNSCHRLIRKTDLFKSIRNDIKTNQSTFELMRDLVSNSEIYSNINNPSTTTWVKKDYNALNELKLFNVKQPISLILQAYNKLVIQENRQDDFSKLLRYLSIVSFRYNVICNKQANEQEAVYNNMSLKLKSSTNININEVVNMLKSVYPSDAEFTTAFINKELRTTYSRNKEVMKYLLFKIETHNSSQDFNEESGKYNIEHILPENPDDEWHEFSTTEIADYKYRIGNMTLLETKMNNDIGNKPFQEKIIVYHKSVLSITKRIFDEYQCWNSQSITTRQSWMANQAKSIWKINF